MHHNFGKLCGEAPFECCCYFDSYPELMWSESVGWMNDVCEEEQRLEVEMEGRRRHTMKHIV